MRPFSSRWDPSKVIFSPTSSYSTLVSVSIPFQIFLRSPSTALFPFSKHVSSLKAKFFPRLKVLRYICASSFGPFKESLFLLCKVFLRPLLTYALPGWLSFLSVINITKLERLHRVASRTITGCLSSSPIPLLLSWASYFSDESL